MFFLLLCVSLRHRVCVNCPDFRYFVRFAMSGGRGGANDDDSLPSAIRGSTRSAQVCDNPQSNIDLDAIPPNSTWYKSSLFSGVDEDPCAEDVLKEMSRWAKSFVFARIAHGSTRFAAVDSALQGILRLCCTWTSAFLKQCSQACLPAVDEEGRDTTGPYVCPETFW